MNALPSFLSGLTTLVVLVFSSTSCEAQLASVSPGSGAGSAAGRTSSAAAAQPGGRLVNGVAARVNDRVITHNEVDQAMKFGRMMILQGATEAGSKQEKLKELREKTLDDLIDRELILDEAAQKGAKLKPSYIDEDIQRIVREKFEGDRMKMMTALAQTGLTLPKYKELHEKDLIVQIMTSQYARNVPFPSPDERAAYIREHAAQFREGDFIKLRTLAIPRVSAANVATKQKALAEDIRRQLADGGDFASLARSYSQDSFASKGGDWGWISPKALADELAGPAFSLPAGQISKVLEFRGMYYILYVEDKKLGEIKKGKEVDEMVERLILQAERKKARDEWVAKLKKKATIQIF